MKLAVARETAAGEARVALSPDTAKRFVAAGFQVAITRGAGFASGFADDAYSAAGAILADGAAEAFTGADIVLCVDTPDDATLRLIPEGTILIGMLSPLSPKTDFSTLNARHLHAYAMELLPRISRAQSMDVLSSQSNLAGYRAVIEGIAASTKTFPMMMTAAGTVSAARALVLGAGVAGLQAIATAKRLGAIVTGYDVRAVTKEQVESLGAKFLSVQTDENLETGGGYAREANADFKARQDAALQAIIGAQDLVITTALIPGKPAPELITAEMLAAMKPGSVIVDLAAGSGGNCKRSVAGQRVVTEHGVIILGYTDLPSRAAPDASPLYARNLYNFVTTLMVDRETKTLRVQTDDELIRGTLIAKGGRLVHPLLTGA